MTVEERLADVVRPAVFQRDDVLVDAARRGEAAARTAIFDRHAPHVARVLGRVLGADGDIPDLVHDVFLSALADLDRLVEPAALKAWLTGIAVNTARGHIRRRMRRRWLRFFAPEDVPEVEAPVADAETRAAVRAMYRVLDSMDADDRIAFALRFVDGMELTETAAACGVSLATIKRRLARAEDAFAAKAKAEAALAQWLEGGSRWA